MINSGEELPVTQLQYIVQIRAFVSFQFHLSIMIKNPTFIKPTTNLGAICNIYFVDFCEVTKSCCSFLCAFDTRSLQGQKVKFSDTQVIQQCSQLVCGEHETHTIPHKGESSRNVAGLRWGGGPLSLSLSGSTLIRAALIKAGVKKQNKNYSL